MESRLKIVLRDLDRRIWEEELEEFVPREVYDAHTHVYDLRIESPSVTNQVAPTGFWAQSALSDWAALDAADALLMPGRTVHRIAFGNPFQDCPWDQADEFTARETVRDPASAALMLVKPTIPPEHLAERVKTLGFRGFKPYRMHSITGDVVECRIEDFLPAGQIEVADQHGLMIMLHMSKRAAVGDPENLADLERLTKRFPRVKWILAHCARSYYDRPLLKAADRLKKMPSLWYDISSVCDSDAMDVLLSIAGPDRVMYGSDDLPVGVARGKYITFGQAWAYLSEENHSLNLSHCLPDMTFTRYESLRAFRRACRRQGYGPGEIDKVFRANAAALIAARNG